MRIGLQNRWQGPRADAVSGWGQAPVGRYRWEQDEGFLSFLYWGRRCIIHTNLYAGPYVHTVMYTKHCMRLELCWAGEVSSCTRY